MTATLALPILLMGPMAAHTILLILPKPAQLARLARRALNRSTRLCRRVLYFVGR